MFNNIGGKIKTLAIVITVMEILASIIVGIIYVSATGGLSLLIAAAVCLLAWISSFLLYGFGQLIENTDKLVYTYVPDDEEDDDYSDDDTEEIEEPTEYIEDNESELAEVFKDDFQRQNYSNYEIENLANQYNVSTDLVSDILSAPTNDLNLIIQEQKNLFNPNEMRFIKDELSRRQFMNTSK